MLCIPKMPQKSHYGASWEINHEIILVCLSILLFYLKVKGLFFTTRFSHSHSYHWEIDVSFLLCNVKLFFMSQGNYCFKSQGTWCHQEFPKVVLLFQKHCLRL